MKKVLKHFIVFMYAGIIFSEESREEISSRRKKVVMPEHAYAYYYVDTEYVVDGKKTYKGKDINRTGYFFPDGVVYDYDRAKKEIPNNSILLSNMKNNGYKFVVKTRIGNIVSFERKDKVV